MPKELFDELELRAPGIKKMADVAIEKGMQGIITSLIDFLADPDLLYLAVWYITTRGLSITILGAPKPPEIITAAN